MPAVSTPTAVTQNAWTCPTCRHGSPDPRDEVAHLDAHRQLGQFFQEWDAAVAVDRDQPPERRPVAAVLGVFVAIVVLVAGVLYWSLDGPAGNVRAVPPTPAAVPVVPGPPPATPAAESPAPTPQVPASPSPGTGAPTEPTDVPAPAAVVAPSAGSARAAAPAAPTAPAPQSVSTPAPAPQAPVVESAPPPPGPAPTPPPAQHLVQLCLLGTCVSIA